MNVIRPITLPMGFQFTHPGRGATMATILPTCRYTSFNSRTPGGVRPIKDAIVNVLDRFQFTHPGRGATQSRTP